MEEVGRMTIIRDPKGRMSAYSRTRTARRQEGSSCWDQLERPTRTPRDRFYEAVFGWTTTDPGPENRGYRIFEVSQTSVAGHQVSAEQLDFTAQSQPLLRRRRTMYNGTRREERASSPASDVGDSDGHTRQDQAHHSIRASPEREPPG